MEIYKDVGHTIEERVEDLLGRMTLQQKLGQLQCTMAGMGMPEDILERFMDGVGEVTAFGGFPTAEENADFAKKVQDTVIPKNNIPVLMHCEAVTGLNAAGAAIFPSAIGLGATFNPDTIEKMADSIRSQMVAIGMRQALSPVMDVARDPRWGRVGETYGEDPALCAAMSVAFTKGLQSEDPKNGAVVTGKHFLGYGFSEGGLNMAANPIPARELREVYAKPFQAAITEAGLLSIMNSYGSVDGDLIIKSKHILTDLLRKEMGFEGIVVSDYMSINKAVDLKVSKNPTVAGIEALEAGLDIELPLPYGYTQDLADAVKKGEIEESLIDRAVRRILAVKFKLGLFENPYPRFDMIAEAYGRETTYSLSLKAARESIVLVKNDCLLPLDKDRSRIAVIGPHADSIRLLFGCYTYPASIDMFLNGSMSEMAGMEGQPDADVPVPAAPKTPCLEGSAVRAESPVVTEVLGQMFGEKTPTILASIQKKCPNAHVVYEKGCDVAGTSKEGFAAAIAAAKEAEVVILTVGGKYGWGDNCTTGEGIDSDRIGLTGIQEELAKAIFETGTPAVLVHMDTRPLSSEFISENYPAVIENWFPGDTGGEALADVLFGDYNPAGRLPVTAARNAGQIPVYAAHRNGSGYSAGNQTLSKYVEGTKQPLHYFGEGVSYTAFAYSNLKLDQKVNTGGMIKLSCDITNTGERDGEEVVQVYVTDELASMMRPNKELAGFARVAIESGKTKTVHFAMRADQFAFLDVNMKWIVEAGKMTVRIGGSSEDIRLTGVFEIENTSYIDGRNRGFYAKTRIE
jgi:beta-glucosidase